MLRLMRQNASSWIIKFLLAIIVLVFIFMGVGSYDARKKGGVATVNGDLVSIEDYQESYNRVIEQLRQRFGKNLNEDMLKMLQVKKQAIDRLIENKLLMAEAANLKLSVSDKELADSIKNIKAFQNNGVFDKDQYRKVLSYNSLTPEHFELKQKEAMLLDKMRSIVFDSVKVSEQDAREWYNWNDATVAITALLFDPLTYSDIQPAEDDIKAYFDEHKEQYKTEQKRKVRYIKIDPESFLAKAEVADSEVKEYYDSNPDEFFSAKTVEARHILKRVDEGADDQTVEQKKQEIMAILKKAREGEDFAELAKKYSEGPSKDKGGLLGAFKRDAMVKPFADKAFSMKAGEISDPVRTKFGWHIIKVEKVNEATTKTFEQAQAEIRKKLAEEKSKTLAYDEAVEIYESSFEGDDLVLAAEERQLPIQKTDFFASSDTVPGIKSGRKFAQKAFELAMMEISDILELDDAYYLIQVFEKMDPILPEFETVKEAVKADLIASLQDKKASEEASTLLASLKNGADMEAEAKKRNIELLETGYFKRNGTVPNIGYEREIADAAFALAAENKYPENVIKTSKGYYIIAFKSRKLPKEEQFEKSKNSIISRLLQEKQASVYSDWVAQLKSKSEIQYEQRVFQ